jgi:hypothetical protein
LGDAGKIQAAIVEELQKTARVRQSQFPVGAVNVQMGKPDDLSLPSGDLWIYDLDMFSALPQR